jgi:hypothetical protein
VVPLSQVNANVSDERLWSLRRDGFSAVYADIGEYLRRFVAPASSLAVHAACRRVSDATAGDTCDCGHRLPQAPQYW